MRKAEGDPPSELIGARQGHAAPSAAIRGWLRRTVGAALPLVALMGCASSGAPFARPALETLPFDSPLRVATLADPDAWMRHHLMFGDPQSALSMLDGAGGKAVADELLRSLQQAIVLREAGDFAASNHLLEWADQEAERRHVRSVSRTAASLVINDRILSYTPTPGERGMIPYYRMLNHLALGDPAGAAVEARRISALLDHGGRGEVRSCREDGMLHYLAGLVFEAAGEANDALVSLRRAEESFATCGTGDGGGIATPNALGTDLARVASFLGFRDIAESARTRYSLAPPIAGTGRVLVVIERGFVAHLTEESLQVPIYTEEIDTVAGGDAERLAAVGAVVAAQLVASFGEYGDWSQVRGDPRYRRGYRETDDVHLLRLAWPALRKSVPSGNEVRVLLGSETAGLVRVGDLSTIVSHDLDERRAAMLARLVTRAIARYLVTNEVEKKAEEEGGKLFATFTGLLANAAANELERADTRSWTLLPDEVSVAAFTLPAGTHQIQLQMVTPGGGAAGKLDLDPIDVRPGTVTVVHRRLWSDDLPMLRVESSLASEGVASTGE